MLAFLYYLNLKIKVDTVVCHIYFNSHQSVTSNINLHQSIYIQLVTVTNIFEAIQRCQHCQLCALRENSNVCIAMKHVRTVSKIAQHKAQFLEQIFSIIRNYNCQRITQNLQSFPDSHKRILEQIVKLIYLSLRCKLDRIYYTSLFEIDGKFQLHTSL